MLDAVSTAGYFVLGFFSDLYTHVVNDLLDLSGFEVGVIVIALYYTYHIDQRLKEIERRLDAMTSM